MSSSAFCFYMCRGAVVATVALTAMMLAGCPSKPVRKPPAHPVVRPAVTRPSSGWSTWRGTVPCEPYNTSICRSKDVVLTLLPGNTYRMETTIRRQGKPYSIVSNGRFQWDSSGTIITLAAKDEGARLRIDGRRMERLPSINDDSDDAELHRGYVLHRQ